jgi:hypothetical protein
MGDPIPILQAGKAASNAANYLDYYYIDEILR